MATTKVPAITRHWPKGKTLNNDEARALVARVCGLPEWDRGLATARLTELVSAGWLVRKVEPDGRSFTYTRPQEDPDLTPEPRVARVHGWVPGHIVNRTVELPDGTKINVPTEVPERHYLHSEVRLPE